MRTVSWALLNLIDYKSTIAMEYSKCWERTISLRFNNLVSCLFHDGKYLIHKCIKSVTYMGN